ncbi:hypothetical protein CEXT_808241 [Caerostris extrusa]|uniref:C2H2-type domain-containing protein n=1 Tax=Caerostris extrusa TaxID=172846 RepID=A0AAV4S767_CAEEX|nr:hypothetical protein CEXT_808241 [Caerostris extrusa]
MVVFIKKENLINVICDNGSSRSPSPLPCSGTEDLPFEEECSEDEEQEDSSVKENSDNFVCNICNEVFSHPTNLRTHVLNHKKLKPYICKVCDKRFKKQVSLDRHKAQGDCRESDENNESLELKKDQSAFEKKVSFCDSCISLLSVEQNSLRSLNYNFTHSNVKKGYICNICSKSFLFKQEFDEHYPNHTKYKPYPCDLCDRAFSCENSLKFHYKSHK